MTVVTYGTIVISIAQFIRIQSLKKKYGNGDVLVQAGAACRPFVERGQYWRLLTAGFVHMSVPHLFMNCYALYSLGRPLEGFLGSAMFALLLILSIVIGNIFAVWMDKRVTISGGLSTGIYGLMAFFLALIYATSGPEAILKDTGLLYTIVLNLLINCMPGVSWQGHLGGFCTGLVLMRLFQLF